MWSTMSAWTSLGCSNQLLCLFRRRPPPRTTSRCETSGTTSSTTREIALGLLEEFGDGRSLPLAFWEKLADAAEQLRLERSAAWCHWRCSEIRHGVIRADLTLVLPLRRDALRQSPAPVFCDPCGTSDISRPPVDVRSASPRFGLRTCPIWSPAGEPRFDSSPLLPPTGRTSSPASRSPCTRTGPWPAPQSSWRFIALPPPCPRDDVTCSQPPCWCTYLRIWWSTHRSKPTGAGSLPGPRGCQPARPRGRPRGRGALYGPVLARRGVRHVRQGGGVVQLLPVYFNRSRADLDEGAVLETVDESTGSTEKFSFSACGSWSACAAPSQVVANGRSSRCCRL